MKRILVLFLLFQCFYCNSQILNSLTRTKTYSSEIELIKANPELTRTKVVVDKKSIRILNEENALKTEIQKSAIQGGLNSFIFSPNREYFVAFEETETEANNLYFYKADGSLLAKQRVNIYPNVQFSSNGEYVIAFNTFGRQVFVFNKMGLLLISEDYIDLIKDKTKVLENVLVSEDAGQLLINAGEEAYLIDSKTKQHLFVTKVGRVRSGRFYSGKQKIALKTLSSENYKYDLMVLSKSDGKLLDKINTLSKIDFIPTGITILKDSLFHEYNFK